MRFSFELQKDIQSVLPAVKEAITKNGGKFSGDGQAGKFEGKGITGSYVIQGKKTDVMITKIPFGTSERKIKEEILKYFGIK